VCGCRGRGALGGRSHCAASGLLVPDRSTFWVSGISLALSFGLQPGQGTMRRRWAGDFAEPPPYNSAPLSLLGDERREADRLVRFRPVDLPRYESEDTAPRTASGSAHSIKILPMRNWRSETLFKSTCSSVRDMRRSQTTSSTRSTRPDHGATPFPSTKASISVVASLVFGAPISGHVRDRAFAEPPL
jgi:hypothetical protein